MRANVIHSSYSSIIYEGHDFSCALVGADGRLIAQSLDDNPLHIFAVPYSAREIVKTFEINIHENDIFLHNDPYSGGTHLNDVLMLYPIFVDSKLLLFSAVRCHWGDIGGMTPGSLSGRVTEILQEGIWIVPTKICDRGRMNEPLLQLILQNVRGRAEREGDFNTMLGASRKADEHVRRLAAQFSPSGLLDAIEELFTRSESVMRERIEACPDGVYFSDGYIESDGHSKEPLAARLKLTIAGDRIIADFTGTSPQTRGPTNVGPSMALNAVCTVTKAFLDPFTPINHGSFQPVEVIAPEGTFINARWPAPCGGMAEVKALLDFLMVAALGQALPHYLVGGLKGGANHIMIGGSDSVRGEYLLYEYPAGGTGATMETDGGTVVRAFPEGDFNSVQSVENIELALPMRVEYYGIREGSCGDGRWRGGFGMRRSIRLLADSARLSVLSERNVIPPWGVMGGMSGAANRFVVERDGCLLQPSEYPGKVADFPLTRGDLVIVETAGGGGCGDPLERDVIAVQEDIELGYMSAEEARGRYGVVIVGGELDKIATNSRPETRFWKRRLRIALQASKDEMFDNNKRIIEMTINTALKLNVSDGDLVEIALNRGAAIRGWARIREGNEPAVYVGESQEV